MEEKISRIQSRADSEIRVVRACQTDIDKIIADKIEEKEANRCEIIKLNEQIRITDNQDLQREYARRARQCDNKMKYTDGLLEIFRKTSDKLEDFIDLIQCFYDCKQYRFIVRKIPEKKLPALVGDIGHTELLYELVENLYDVFNARMMRSRVISDMYSTIRKRKQDEEKQKESMMSSAYAEDDEYIAFVKSEAVTPVVIENTNTNRNDKDNKNLA